MALRLVHGTPPPEGPRKRVRESANRNKPRCQTCGGHEFIAARNGNVTAKLCVGCLLEGRRREMGSA